MPNIHVTYCNLLPIKKGKVVLYYSGEKYAGGCRYLAEEFIRRNATCEPVWVSEKKKVGTPEGVRSVCGHRAMRHELATACAIIADGRLNKYWAKGFILKPGQTYFQIGHEGGLGPMKIGADVHEPNLRVLKRNKVDAQRTVAVLSGSEWESENLVAASYYRQPPTEWGNPCNDVLVHPGDLERTVRENIGIKPSTKIVLYAPAERDWVGAQPFPKPNYAQVLAALRKRFGGEWILLVRCHSKPGKADADKLPSDGEPGVRDVSGYPDSTELLAAADVVISDYSTCAFDFLLTRRPVFLYAPDEAEYAEHHGLYYPLEDAPMPLARDHAELCRAIEGFREGDYREKVEQFLRDRGNKDDGKACSRMVDWILNNALPLPPYDLTATRKEVIKGFWKSLGKLFYSHRNLNADHQRFKVLGISFKCLRRPIPPRNPYADLPIQQNKIAFKNALNGFSCNPKYIVQEILRRNLAYELVWCIAANDKYVIKHIDEYPKGVRLVIAGTEEAMYEFSTAKVWIDTVYRMYQYRGGISKRQGQFYLQLWHASFGIKKPIIGRTPVEENWARPAESQIDYLISNSDCESEHYLKPVFQFHGVRKAPIVKLGHPRSDIFFAAEDVKGKIRAKVNKALGIPVGHRLLLWAPTFRDDFNTNWVNLDYERVRRALAERFGGTWEIATRMHAMMTAQRGEFRKPGQHIINASEYVDVQELLVATDVLISDYSSIVCDFVLQGRPAFLYIPDREEYGMTRELVYPPEVTPCPIAVTNDSLIGQIERFDEKVYEEKLVVYLKKMGCVEDGHAAVRVVDLIEKLAPLES